MKKLISVLLLIALLISICGCQEQMPTEPSQVPDTTASVEITEATETTEATEVTVNNEFADVNELEPNEKGVYQIHSAVGVQNIANHPDAKFELLCDVDLGGITWNPIAKFTGDLAGGNFTISNFTIEGSVDGCLGFVAVNEGALRNLGLANVTVVSDANAKNIGLLAGINNGNLTRCTITGSALTVDAAAEGAFCGAAAGISTDDIRNTNVEVNMAFSAAGSATVGGLAGSIDGGKYQYCDTNGELVVAGTNKTVGLLAGTAKNAEIKACAFVGPKNTVDGKLYNELTGSAESCEITKCLWRDNSAEPISEASRNLRSIAEQYMRAMGSIEWYVDRTLYKSCHCGASMCYGAFYPGTLHKGILYNHKGSGLESSVYLLDENGFMKDWVYTQPDYDGWDMYMGNDCSTSVQKAWARVSNTACFTSTRNAAPIHGMGTIAVGDWAWNQEPPGDEITEFKQYRDATGEQAMYEAYAQMRMADGVVAQSKETHHIRMAAADAVVVRDQDGLIDPTYSYVLMHEQGYVTRDTNFYTSWKLDHKYTFANLYETYYVPFTCEEFLTGEMETPEAWIEGNIGGRAGLTTGMVRSNYFVDSVSMVITDASGNEVFNKRMFTTTDRQKNAWDPDDLIRNLPFEFDMGMFGAPLMTQSFTMGQTYHVEVTAYLGTGDVFQVNSYDFTQGVV